ncbi:hypothetical protein, partial [Actinorugispora endophytica]|uniref:hypothetical protein n=1 Tax=Actinorugispora endophytica TaxID=1605990 RepID=UPI001AADAFAC
MEFQSAGSAQWRNTGNLEKNKRGKVSWRSGIENDLLLSRESPRKARVCAGAEALIKSERRNKAEN